MNGSLFFVVIVDDVVSFLFCFVFCFVFCCFLGGVGGVEVFFLFVCLFVLFCFVLFCFVLFCFVLFCFVWGFFGVFFWGGGVVIGSWLVRWLDERMVGLLTGWLINRSVGCLVRLAKLKTSDRLPGWLAGW